MTETFTGAGNQSTAGDGAGVQDTRKGDKALPGIIVLYTSWKRMNYYNCTLYA